MPNFRELSIIVVIGTLAVAVPNASPKPWDYQPTTRDPSYSAWYQVPKPGPAPYPSPSVYERPPPSSYDRPYNGYGVPRHGGYSPDMPGNMMPQMPRKTSVSGYYPHQQSVVSSGSDGIFISAINRYHSLLLKKKKVVPTTAATTTTTTTTKKTTTTTTIAPTTPKQKTRKTTQPAAKITKVTLPTKVRLTTTTTTITPSTAPAPSRLLCKHRPSDKEEQGQQSKKKKTTKSQKANKLRAWKKLVHANILPRIDRDNLLGWKYWPNAELFAAIKDVVNKFRLSIDQSGLQQDMRHMGTQLQSTWDQLRRGPVNEQLGRLFERAQQAVADSVNEDEPRRLSSRRG